LRKIIKEIISVVIVIALLVPALIYVAPFLVGGSFSRVSCLVAWRQPSTPLGFVLMVIVPATLLIANEVRKILQLKKVEKLGKLQRRLGHLFESGYLGDLKESGVHSLEGFLGALHQFINYGRQPLLLQVFLLPVALAFAPWDVHVVGVELPRGEEYRVGELPAHYRPSLVDAA